MKVRLLKRTNIEDALSKVRGLSIKDSQDQINQIIKDLGIKRLNNFDLDLLNKQKIFHLDHIKKICIDYRLRFLDIKYFKNNLPDEAFKEIDRIENLHDTKLGEYKVMAPSILFRLKKTDDPLLFVPLGNDYFYLVHKWGNDLSPMRKVFMWPFKNIWNLLISIFIFSLVVTELTPISFFTRTPDVSTYWMLLFFIFKAHSRLGSIFQMAKRFMLKINMA